MNEFLQIKNQKENSVDIYVYGTIISGSDKWDSSEVVFDDFKNAIDTLDDDGTINMYINSGGGSVFATQGIISMMRRKQEKGTKINAYIDGLAGSCASFLPLIADKIYCYKSSLMMIHLPMGGAWGNVIKIQATIDLLNKIKDDLMIPTYLDKSTDELTEELLNKMLEEETWFNCYEIQKYFDVELLEGDKDSIAYVDKELYDSYKNAPKCVKPMQIQKNERKGEADELALAKAKLELAMLM